MSYHNFNLLFGGGPAQDRVRGVTMPAENPTLSTVDEVFTSENWIIRIYKVKDLDVVGRSHTAISSNADPKKKASTLIDVSHQALRI